ncbi:HAD family hydrolase [Nocardiopsis aegyptia]|uniref:FMN phosphatase YigB (HAD superfamily) n=1 Tax=Nocardiopsis aegyptia TaxID=220378 RepID=A0A7Z0J9C4_9ACTN|nr:HAD family hydrolase [Nocardiopsis aegyptia]NYJ33886.1 FMN phosphatase YigB (HAD superfamily) [Nocardiopsis aegyptia]
MAIRTVVFDVGETLVDETRIFARWADRFGIPHMAFFGTIGGVIASGGTLTDGFRLLVPGFDLAAESERWRAEDPDGEREHFTERDLYPDVRPAFKAMREAGLSLVIAGNQPPEAGPVLAAMELGVDGIGISDDWGVAKPDPAFFDRTLALAARSRPGLTADEVLYVGDRVDNDVLPAGRAGMRTVLLRRGLYGYRHAAEPGADRADAVLDDLHQLASWTAERG